MRLNPAVMHEYRHRACDHIVRVEERDCEVAHVLGAREVVHTQDVLRLSPGPDELVSRREAARVGPSLVGGVPEGMVGCGVQGGGRAADAAGTAETGVLGRRFGCCGQGEVGELGVEVEVELGDRFRHGGGGGRVCGGALVADLDVLDLSGGAVGHEDGCGGGEAVLAAAALDSADRAADSAEDRTAGGTAHDAGCETLGGAAGSGEAAETVAGCGRNPTGDGTGSCAGDRAGDGADELGVVLGPLLAVAPEVLAARGGLGPGRVFGRLRADAVPGGRGGFELVGEAVDGVAVGGLVRAGAVADPVVVAVLDLGFDLQQASGVVVAAVQRLVDLLAHLVVEVADVVLVLLVAVAVVPAAGIRAAAGRLLRYPRLESRPAPGPVRSTVGGRCREVDPAVVVEVDGPVAVGVDVRQRVGVGVGVPVGRGGVGDRVVAGGVAVVELAGGGVVPAGGHVDPAAGGLGPAGLVAEVAGGVGGGEDLAEWVVGGGPGQRGPGCREVGDDVGVPVGPGEYRARAGVDADNSARGVAAVGGGAVAGDRVAHAGVGEGTGACALRRVGEDATKGVIRV